MAADRLQTAERVIKGESVRLVAHLSESLEAIGLPERQEAAAKRLLKRQIYDTMTRCVSALRGEYQGDGYGG